MKYVVAVSGGVDSVVLLDMMARQREHELIVAHFDHGIREDSAADARFVQALAQYYELPFEGSREELGKQASEQKARQRRYAFLRALAIKYSATIVTAHHQGDVIESIAINLVRGTGWRGLAVMNDAAIERPLLATTKGEIYDYANSHNLEWVEDESNATDAYLRNRLRRTIGALDQKIKNQIIERRLEQCRLAHTIDEEASRLKTDSRHFLTMVDESSALELLRAELATQSLALARPQRGRLLHAIKVARPGNVFEAGEGITVQFTAREFVVKHPL